MDKIKPNSKRQKKGKKQNINKAFGQPIIANSKERESFRLLKNKERERESQREKEREIP